MDNLIHADIFFFVTTIAVVVVAVLFVVVLIYILVIMRRAKSLIDDAKGIVKEIKEETVLIREDIKDARAKVTRGLQIKSIFDFISGVVSRRKAAKSREKKK